MAALAVGLACAPELTAPAPGTTSDTTSDTAPASEWPAVASAPGGAATASSGNDTTTAARRPVTSRPASYDAILPGPLGGRDILDERAALVPEIARRNDLTTRATAQLLADPTVSVSAEGHVYVVEPAVRPTQAREAVAAAAADTDPSAGVLGAVPVLGADTRSTDTFRLQSRPGATRTIFLDFDGADVTGSMWANQGVTGLQPGFNQANSDPASFSAEELTFVRQVWRQVSETYAPFDVNVTTLDPGREAWYRSDSADTTYGSRVVITSSTTPQQKLCGGCAGIAGLRTFGKLDSRAYYQPAWVFVTGFARSAPTVVAQTVAHEVGHNVGLGHDGQNNHNGDATDDEYTFGSNRWGPVMGGSTQRAVSQWSRGEYGDATNHEDDLAIITQNNLPLVRDDHGDGPATATGLAGASLHDVEGVISTRTDVDVFRLDVPCTLALDARVSGIGPQSTLDLRLDLLSDTGAQLASHSPTTTHDTRSWDAATVAWKAVGTDASLSRSLSPGTYYLRVDGTGSGSPTGADMLGWSDYGSLGRYRLTSTACATTTSSAPSASPTAPTASPSTSPTGTPTSSPTSPGPTTGSGPTASPSSSPSVPAPTAAPTSAPPVTVPGAPLIGRADSGTRGRPVSLTVRWSAPSTTGGSALTGYTITAHRLDRRGATVRTLLARGVPANATTVQLFAPGGRYRVSVQALNAVGASRASALSRVVTAR